MAKQKFTSVTEQKQLNRRATRASRGRNGDLPQRAAMRHRARGPQRGPRGTLMRESATLKSCRDTLRSCTTIRAELDEQANILWRRSPACFAA